MTIAHYELQTTDPAAAKKFYKAMFKWKFQDMPMEGGTYTVVQGPDGKGFGGIMQQPPDAPHPMWMAYVLVHSVKAKIKRAEQLGAKILVPYKAIPDMGAFGVFLDPQGAAIAIWEESKKAKPAAPPTEAAAPVKETAKKKAAPKKKAASKKKVATKRQATKKKAAPKKAAPKKAAPKKAAPKKAAPKKAAPKKKAAPRKKTAKK